MWQDPPGDMCVAIIQKLELPAIARLALVNDHWCSNVVAALQIKQTWLLLHFLQASAPFYSVFTKVPRGLASDAAAFDVTLRMGKEGYDEVHSMALETHTKPGKLLQYGCRTFAGFFHGQHCPGKSKATTDGDSTDGVESESNDESTVLDDDECSEDDDEYRNRACKRAVKIDLVELNIETAQRALLTDVQRALQASVTRMEPDAVACFLHDVLWENPYQAGPGFRGRLSVAYANDNKLSGLDRRVAQPGPSCFASVLGAVVAGCRMRNTWSAEQLYGVAMHLFQVVMTQYEWCLPSVVAQPLTASGSAIRQPVELSDPWDILVLGKKGDNLRVGTALQARWRTQIAHPMWDLHTLLAPLVAAGLCSAATQINVLSHVTSKFITSLRSQPSERATVISAQPEAATELVAAEQEQLVAAEQEQPEQEEAAGAAEGGGEEGKEGEESEGDAHLSFAMLNESERCIWAAWFLHYACAESACLTNNQYSGMTSHGQIYASVEPDPSTIMQVAALGALKPTAYCPRAQPLIPSHPSPSPAQLLSQSWELVAS